MNSRVEILKSLWTSFCRNGSWIRSKIGPGCHPNGVPGRLAGVLSGPLGVHLPHVGSIPSMIQPYVRQAQRKNLYLCGISC